jgi:hypothetical protein
MTQQTTAAKRALPLGVQAALAAGAIAALTLFGACDTGTSPEPDPKLCECPPGTTHKAGEKCCDGENCACEEEQQPILCECPEGTFHDEGEACCEGEDCDCKEAYNVFLGAKQIRVEDTTGLADRAEIQDALDLIDSPIDSCVVHFKAMNKNPIMVIEGTHNFRVEDNKFFIGIDAINQYGVLNPIYNAIMDIYNPGDTPLMSKLPNNGERKGD